MSRDSAWPGQGAWAEEQEAHERMHFNRPGLHALRYRLGRHAEFLFRMKERLATLEVADARALPPPRDGADGGEPPKLRPLQRLTTHDANDPALALLDAWAVVADVVTFYTERIANEGFIGTAAERRSVLELARSISYELKPGVAAGVWLAFTVDEAPGAPEQVMIGENTPVVSIPGAGEKPQTFEVVEAFEARRTWNRLRPRQEARINLFEPDSQRIVLQGVDTGLRPGMPLLMVGDERFHKPGSEKWDFRIVEQVLPEPARNRTWVTWRKPLGDRLGRVDPYVKHPPPRVYALRLRTALFGHNAAYWQDMSSDARRRYMDAAPAGITAIAASPQGAGGGWVFTGHEDGRLARWNLPALRMEWVAEAHDGPVTALALLPAGANELPQVLSAGKDRLIRRWGPEAGVMPRGGSNEYGNDIKHAPPVLAMIVVRNGAYAIAGYGDGTIRVWNVETERTDASESGPLTKLFGAARFPDKEHLPAVTALAELPTIGDPVLVMVGLGDGRLLIWLPHLDGGDVELPDLVFEDPPQSGRAHEGAVTSLAAFRVQNQVYVVSGGEDGRVKVWRVGLGEKERAPMVYRVRDAGITAVAVRVAAPPWPPPPGGWLDPNMITVLAAAEDGLVHRWGFSREWREDEELAEQLTTWSNVLHGHRGAVGAMSLAPGAGQLFTGGEDAWLMSWDLVSQRTVVLPRRVYVNDHWIGEPEEWPGFGMTGPVIDLDGDFPQLLEASWLVLDTPRAAGRAYPYTELYRGGSVEVFPHSAFNLSGKVTRFTPDTLEHIGYFGRRETLVYAQSEELVVADPLEPIEAPVMGQTLELDSPCAELPKGRRLIVRGRNARARIAADDLTLTYADGSESDPLPVGMVYRTVRASEATGDGRRTWFLREPGGREGTLVAGAKDVEFAPADPEDPEVAEEAVLSECRDEGLYGELILEAPLAHDFDRTTVAILANVGRATHGATKADEVLGQGDATLGHQRFTLNKPNLTFVRDPKSGEVVDTLTLRVNKEAWHKVASLNDSGPEHRHFILQIDNDQVATVIAGDGEYGSRLPTGVENVTATYRHGIGLAGEVRAGALTQMPAKPHGIRGVVNPLAALGGMDPESLDDARRIAPSRVMTLERVVSLRDVEHAAADYPGIGMAQAVPLLHRRTWGVYLTIADHQGRNVPEGSDLFRGLRRKLHGMRDPSRPLWIGGFHERRFELEVALKVDPDFIAEDVREAVAGALSEAFAFPRRRFGQGVHLDEIFEAIHTVRGVLAADVDRLHEVGAPDALVTGLKAGQVREAGGAVLPPHLWLIDPGTLVIKDMPL